MSFDVSLSHICPHEVVQERLELDLTDRRNLRPLRPPSNELVKLWVNGYFVERDNEVWGYDLIKDETRVDSGRKVYFRNLVRSQIDLFELTYTTIAKNCRRCASLRVEDDFFFNPLGRVVIVEDEAKLLQDEKKFVITVRGSNPFHLYIGTAIVEIVGSKLVDSSFTETTITQEIVDTLQNLKDLQIQQENLQVVTDREFLYRIILIDVKQSEIDPSVFNVLIVSVNRAGDNAEFEQMISVPGAQNLLFGDSRGTPGDTNYPGPFQTVT